MSARRAPEPPAGGSGQVPANPFWDFSFAFYARPGVAEACLALQDRLGLDVNLLLFGLWAGRNGHRLSVAELARLQEAVAPWHGEVVLPLRGLRRWLKQPAAADPQTASLRTAVKALELEAERLEQDRLQATLPLPPGALDRAAAAANLERLVGAGVPEAAALLAALG